ncbi:MAG: rod shape-determining protein MreC [Candidatus Pacebacteria bacterium]|nr:rod shape-determining protein MreC [Candidatus Paceibacterota bacterium]
MKTPFHQSISRRRIRPYLLPGIALAVGVLLLSTHTFEVLVPDAFVRTLYTVASPLWHARDTVADGESALTTSFQSTVALATENAALRKALRTAQREVLHAEVIARENERLRALMGRLPADERAIVAGIIQGTDYAPYDMCVVDAGELSGARESMIVMSPEGVALGGVARAHTRHSVVTFFTSAGVQTNALVTHASGTVPVVLMGQGAGTMTFRLSQEHVVSLGDRVALPGFALSPIGIVVHIEGGAEDVFQTAYVAPLVSYATLEHVWIDTTSTLNPIVELLEAEAVPDSQATTTTHVR